MDMSGAEADNYRPPERRPVLKKNTISQLHGVVPMFVLEVFIKGFLTERTEVLI